MGKSLEVRHLQVRRGTFEMKDVSLRIEAGEIFSILGQTGSGKTVLMEAFSGAFTPERGSVYIDGKDVTRISPGERGIGVVFQDYALFPHKTVRENVRYGLDRAGVPKEEGNRHAEEMLEMFGISAKADQYPGSISGGEAQRTALARALVLEPSILLMDEPFAAVDPATKKRMYKTVQQVHERFGCTIVFVTHDFSEAQTLADRIGVILNGQLRLVCPSDQLFSQATSPDLRYFLGLED